MLSYTNNHFKILIFEKICRSAHKFGRNPFFINECDRTSWTRHFGYASYSVCLNFVKYFVIIVLENLLHFKFSELTLSITPQNPPFFTFNKNMAYRSLLFKMNLQCARIDFECMYIVLIEIPILSEWAWNCYEPLKNGGCASHITCIKKWIIYY